MIAWLSWFYASSFPEVSGYRHVHRMSRLRKCCCIASLSKNLQHCPLQWVDTPSVNLITLSFAPSWHPPHIQDEIVDKRDNYNHCWLLLSETNQLGVRVTCNTSMKLYSLDVCTEFAANRSMWAIAISDSQTRLTVWKKTATLGRMCQFWGDRLRSEP